MKIRNIAVAAVATLALSLPAMADEYSFKVTNNTDTKITKILVSEDGKKFGFFDIGAGIPVGKTVTLVWDSSTDGESCEQYFKAVFSNGEQSEAQQFDFCEEDVELEFE
ncbi:MAG TPA: hypothetical protein VNI54_12490 [Thermoanaerobaculia bacterium]|nr:hypothetical protein [Thermoanaerobaculia bacterium]